ncbi:hypothetical protein GCM10011487_20790 [Steroidobacter agaridevorans]|uniref:Uncharacterized protein n=1 Tax=Steroidobacter agaridevorans TaxID=2695856 RepID=A0A829Y9U4_9GAMM|nr:hypothetical protein GCM10011487_20790 [Steroidobacter agaridevorans]GFE89951.1 hypothetical protein GCM10011488_49050 [Steroidobacter agaridevorans]
MIGIEVLDQHIGEAGIGGRRPEKHLEGFETAGRSAEADDRAKRRKGAEVRPVGREQPFTARNFFNLVRHLFDSYKEAEHR